MQGYADNQTNAEVIGYAGLQRVAAQSQFLQAGAERAPYVNRLIDMLRDARGRTDDTTTALEGLRNRLFGAVPTNGNNEKLSSVPNGSMDEVILLASQLIAELAALHAVALDIETRL